MRLIPETSYRMIEARLREWKPIGMPTAVERARRLLDEATADAVSLSGPMARDGMPGRRGTPSDPTARAADRIGAAMERLEAAEKWAQVFERTAKDFRQGTPEHRVMRLHYQMGCTLAAIARKERIDRQTVVRRKENFLYRAAWYAAEAGLTRMHDDEL